MAIKLTSTRQSALDNGLKICVHGPAGAGKTCLAATTDGPTVIISAEQGLLSLRGVDIPVIQIDEIGDLEEAYKFIATDPQASHFKWIVIDSLTEIAEKLIALEKSRAPDPRQAYGKMQDKMGDVIRAFRDLPGRNVVMICKQERFKDESNGGTYYGPMMPGNKVAQGIPYFFDLVLCYRLLPDPNAPQVPIRCLQTGRDFTYEAKDRSGALDFYEQPSLAYIKQKILAHAIEQQQQAPAAPAAAAEPVAA